jgi:hypothetical protein
MGTRPDQTGGKQQAKVQNKWQIIKFYSQSTEYLKNNLTNT